MIQLFQESIPFTNKRVDSPVSQNTFLNPVIMPFALNTTLGSNVIETVFYIKNTSVENFYEDIVVALMKEDTNLSSSLSNGVIYTENSTFAINGYKEVPFTLAFDYQKTPNILDGQYQHKYVPVTESYILTDNFVTNTTAGSVFLDSVTTTGFNLQPGDMVYGTNIQEGTKVIAVTGVYSKQEMAEMLLQIAGSVAPDDAFDLNNDSYIDTLDGSLMMQQMKKIELSKPVLVTEPDAKLTIKRASDTDIRVKFSYGYDQISDYDWSKLKSVLVIPTIGNSTTPDTSYIPIRMRIEWLTHPSIYTIRKYFLDVSYSTQGRVN
jgi:hypothetical protein